MRVPEDFVLSQGQILEFTDEGKAGAHTDDLADSPESY